MSATGIPFGQPRIIGRVERPTLEEGWSSVGLLALMLAIVGMAIDDSRWAGNGPHGQSQTGFLVFAILFGGAWGVASAKSRLPAALAHLGGALLAAPFLIMAVAASISLGAYPSDRIDDVLTSLDRFYHDLAVKGVRSSETAPFLLTMGGIAWATGQFAAFVVFRRHRPLTAIFVAGTALVANMAITIRPQYPFLVVFAAASLLLLVRLNILEQSEGWLRRRIGDAEVKALFVRGGIGFVAATLAGTMLLTATAASAPLEGAFDDFDETIVRWGQDINTIVGGVTGPARGPTGLFGPSQTIRGFWEASGEVVFTVQSADGAGQKWRAVTYDSFDGTTNLQTTRVAGERVEAGQPILDRTRERVVADSQGRVPVEYVFTALDLNGRQLLGPDAPFVTDRATTTWTNGPRGPVASIEFTDGIRDNEQYRLTALLRATEEEDGALTESRLRSAGVDYEFWTRRYFDILDGSIGDLTRQTAQNIVERLPENQRTPYDVAKAVQDYLYSSGGFRYETDVTGLCAGGQLVDCFLRTKQGYCEHYATAMVMLLRAANGPGNPGIPARVAMGFLPGKEIADGVWQVDRGAAHAWVEVYFPDYGWVAFDPTPGNFDNGQEPTALDVGEPVPTPTPREGGVFDPNELRPIPSFRPPDLDDNDPASSPLPGAGGGGTVGGGGSGPIPPVLVLVLGGLVVAAVAAGTWTRSMRGPAPEPEAVYRGVARLAGRFGYGPAPTQTAYEYAGTLSEVVPKVRTELQMVARAKVETTYAGRPPRGEALLALRDAYRRLRINLLRLAFRRRR